MGLQICPDCGGKVSTTAICCPHCGRNFQKQYVVWPNCKASVEKAKYCPECGTEISRPSTEIDRQVDDFFRELEALSSEDRDAFFKLIEQDLKKKKGR